MGAYRDAVVALGPTHHYPLDTFTITSPPDQHRLSAPSIGSNIPARMIVHPWFNDPPQPYGNMGEYQRNTLVTTEPGTKACAGPIDIGGSVSATMFQQIDTTMCMTVAMEPGFSTPPTLDTYPHLPGQEFFNLGISILRLRYRNGVPGQSQPTWDLHETAAGTIGIGTWGVWGDVEGLIQDPNWDGSGPLYIPVWGYYKTGLDGGAEGSDEGFVYDSGIPTTDLMDGRPHLLSVRIHGEHQPFSYEGPTTTNTFISISIDGVHRYTSPRGPAIGVNFGPASMNMGLNAFGVDEVSFWDRLLTDAEIAGLADPAVWGSRASFPHPGWPSREGETAGFNANVPDPIMRIKVEPETSSAGVSAPDMDHVWVEQESVGFALASSAMVMGEGTWAGVDPWSSGWKRSGASKWLDMDQDVALIGAPSAGSSTAHADLTQDEDELVGVASGQSSASGDLILHLTLLAEPIAGSSTAYAITIGELSTLTGVSDGAASVTGDLNHGQLEYLAGASDGSSAGTATLSVNVYNYIDGNEVGDGDHAPPMGGGGLRRAHFSPKSVGYVNTRPNRQAVGTGTTTAGPGS